MTVHGISFDEQTGSARPVETIEGAPIAIFAECSILADDAVGLVRSGTESADIAALDDGTGNLTEMVDAIRAQGSSAPIVVVGVSAGAVTSSPSGQTGAYALLKAEPLLGVKPKLVAQSLSGVTGTDLLGAAGRLKAIAYLDGPDTNDAAAISDVASYDSARGHYSDPSVVDTSSNSVASSVCFAAVASILDFWAVPSNVVLNGVDSLSRVIAYEAGDANSQAQLLNDEKINTIIRRNGFRLWGGLSLSTDANYKFINARRTADVIEESIAAALQWAVDKGITSGNVDLVVDSVNDFLANLTARGSILGGSAWVNTNLTTPSAVALGQVYVDYNFTPVYPLHSLIFRPSITNTYAGSVI